MDMEIFNVFRGFGETLLSNKESEINYIQIRYPVSIANFDFKINCPGGYALHFY